MPRDTFAKAFCFLTVLLLKLHPAFVLEGDKIDRRGKGAERGEGKEKERRRGRTYHTINSFLADGTSSFKW